MAEQRKPSLASVLHQPVRWRIVQTLMGRELTTVQLARQLTDIAHATLYRHVNTLIDAGIVEVAAERKVRGTTERTLRLAAETEDAQQPDAEQLRTFFTVFAAGISGSLDRYLAQDDIDPARDGLALRQTALWLADDELPEFAAEFGRLLAPYLAPRDDRTRTRRIMSTIIVPDQ